MEDRVIPIKDDLFNNLAPEEIVEIYENAALYKDKISNVPSVLPIGGQMFIFNLGQDSRLWEKRKKQMRFDTWAKFSGLQ